MTSTNQPRYVPQRARSIQRVFLCGLAVFGFSFLVRAADPLDHWTWRNPLPSPEHFQAVTYAKGTFVAVGNLGTVFSSTNGFDWTQRVLPDAAAEPTIATLFAVAYGGGKFVAGGLGGGYYSADGLVWRQGRQGLETDSYGWFYGMTYGASRFVAVGKYSLIYTSTDGIAWYESHVNQNVFGSEDLFGVAYGAGRFMTVGKFGTIYSSGDGSNWSVAKRNAELVLYGIAYGNGRWVTVGDGGVILTSTNGSAWSAAVSPTRQLLFNVAFLNGKFWAVGGNAIVGQETGIVLSSTDGLQWEEVAVANPYLLTGVAASPGATVVVGYRGTVNVSTNGQTWSSAASDVTRLNAAGVIWARNRFYAVCGMTATPPEPFRYAILSSLNGQDWTLLAEGHDATLNGLCDGNGLLVAVGTKSAGDRGQVIITSEDGLHWSRQDLDPRFGLGGVAFGNGRFVAAGARTLSSNDGTNWLESTDGPYGGSVWFVHGKFFAPARSGFFGLMVSEDGMTWRQTALTESLSYSPVGGVAWFNGQFVATAGNLFHGVFVSKDGDQWQEVKEANVTPPNGTFDGGPRDNLGPLLCADGLLVASGIVYGPRGDVGAIYTSSDATNWVRRFSQSSSGFQLASGGGTLVAVGGNGGILQSGVLPLPAATLGLTAVEGQGGAPTLRLFGVVGRTCRLESSETVEGGWRVLQEVSVPENPLTFRDLNAAGNPRRFYRAVTLP